MAGVGVYLKYKTDKKKNVQKHLQKGPLGHSSLVTARVLNPKLLLF